MHSAKENDGRLLTQTGFKEHYVKEGREEGAEWGRERAQERAQGGRNVSRVLQN